MQTISFASSRRFLTVLALAAFAVGCSLEGDGPQRIFGNPPPPLPPGFCDPINFEEACPAVEWENFGGTGPGFPGAIAQIIDNPDPSGINTSDKVFQLQKFAGEPFAGSFIQLPGPIDFSEGEAYTMKVWASRAVPVLFKLEAFVFPRNPNAGIERTAIHSGSGSWEELCFDFSGRAPGFSSDRITLIFDLGVVGDAANNPNDWTFFVDDITQVDSCVDNGVVTVNLPVDFERDPAIYNFGPEFGFAGGVAQVVANPDRSGLNTTAQTARMQKFAGEVFGGASLTLSGPIDFAPGQAFTMMVWAPRQVPVLFKLEDAVSGLPELGKERQLSHSGSGSWEQLCFDFTGDLAGFSSDRITFIFDNGVMGNADTDPENWTFYFDEIRQVASCDGEPPPVVGENIVINGGFETGNFDGWDQFPGGGVQQIVTDNPSSGTYAANLVVPIRSATDSGIDNVIKASNLAAGNLVPGAAVTVSFDMRGTLSGAGGVVFAELFSEMAGQGTSKAEILSGGPLTPTANWTTYTFDTTLGSDVGGGVSFQLKASCGPVEGCGVDVFFDNVSIVTAGTGEPPPTGEGLGIDFDGAGPFNFIDFEGGFTLVVDNPDPSGLNTSGRVARMLKFDGAPFAGSVLPLASAVNFSAGEAFTVKVWSARPVPVTFKLEGIEVERTQTHDGGSVWQELCFDFSGATAGVPVEGLTFIFDNGVVGDAENDPDNWTFFFDGITQVSSCNGAPPPPPPPVGLFPTITFDDPAVNYTLTDFGGTASVITNDPAGGSNQVVQVLKTSAAEVWAGTTVSTGENLSVPVIPFTDGSTHMTVRVYSPDAGIIVRLKVEDASDSEIFVEADATTTVVNEWETLTFDFANAAEGSPALNLANTYNKISIFFNFGVDGATAGEKVYFFDDIAFGGGRNLVVNGGFETGTFEGWETFPGGGIQQIVTDNPSSGTYAANLVVPVRSQTDAAVDNLIKASNLEAGNLTPGAEVTVSFDMRGALSGAGGVVFAELFSEIAGEGVSKAEILGGGPLAPTADWGTYTFQTTLGSDVDGGVSLQLKVSCGPVEGCGVDVFFDNVSIVLGTVGVPGTPGDGNGGGSGGGEPGGELPEGSIVINGGFETGTFEGWDQFPGVGIQQIVTDNPSSGTYAANLVAPVRGQADPAVDNLIKNSNLQAGNLTPGASVTVSFDMRGTLSGAGGVVFAELFSELAGEGVSKAEILSGGPLTPGANWANYTFETTLGPDVAGGVTLQLKVSCGPVEGCGVDAYFDNVSIVIN